MQRCQTTKGVLTQFKFKIPETVSEQREVRHFSEADWERMPSNTAKANWDFLSATFPFEGAQRLSEKLLHLTKNNIPKRSVNIKKSTHPWLTERREEVVRRKRAAQGTEQEAEAARKCNDILMEEHYDFA